MYKFNEKAGRYIDNKGRFVPQSKVIRLVDRESARLTVRLKGHARLLNNGKIDSVEFMQRMAADIKSAHIRTAIIGAGGEDRLTKSHYGSIGSNLRTEFELLAKFIDAIDEGKLSPQQILNRAGLYGQSSKEAYHLSVRRDRINIGYNVAKRSLDASAKHCRQCPNYSTRGLFVPISEIVAPGHKCDCRGRCKCRVVYKFDPKFKK